MSDVPKEVSQYMAMIGRRGGLSNKKKGPQYFSRIAKMRKRKGRIKNQGS